MIFADRIELIGPGHLPDVLDTENLIRPRVAVARLVMTSPYQIGGVINSPVFSIWVHWTLLMHSSQ